MTREEHQQEQDALRKDALRRMEGFEFIQIAKPAKDCHTGEIWRAAKPNSSCYGFDIAVSKYGIAAYGDFGHLLFNVGASYGMKFLAGDDVSYYIHSKLCQECKDKEFDRKHFQQAVAMLACDQLRDGWIQGDGETLPAVLADDTEPPELDKLIDGIRQEIESMGKDGFSHEVAGETLGSWLNQLIEARDIDEIKEAYEFLEDYPQTCGTPDPSEFNFERAGRGLLVQLHMVNIAARAILDIIAERRAAGDLVHDAGGDA